MDLSSYSRFVNSTIFYNNLENTITNDSIISDSIKMVDMPKISKYDEIVKEKSELMNWDWRLVSSIIYHESKFKPNLVSKYDGAFGLMQFMPRTAKIFGISRSSTPAEQIDAGVKYLDMLDKKLEKHVPNNIERKKFVIAAYNCGILPVYNAIKSAKIHKKDHQVWDNNVENYLYSTSTKKPNYHTRKYVFNVFHKYELYKKTINL